MKRKHRIIRRILMLLSAISFLVACSYVENIAIDTKASLIGLSPWAMLSIVFIVGAYIDDYLAIVFCDEDHPTFYHRW